ncbi:MAG: YdeI/OmpD-associated family protein [Bacteroidota bacterium]
MDSFTAKVDRFQDESLSSLWQYHLSVPSSVADPFIQQDQKRVIVTFPDGTKKHCALMPRGGGEWYIFINQKERKTLKVEVGDEVPISLEVDDSPYGMAVPEELQVLWDQDEEGSRFFHQLTPGKQRTLIYWVSTVKSSDKRITRAMVMLNHVKALKGGVDFKQLNAELKVANQR